jgi:uncharacterized protein (TIGR02001 family)
MRKTLLSAAIAAAFSLPVYAIAADAAPAAAAPAAEAPAAAPASPVTGNFSLVTDYRFRGLSQTAKQPAVQGGLDYAHESGLYLGTWASSINGNQYPNATMEWDFYGGYKFEPVKDVGIDLGLIHVYYPGGKSTAATSTFADLKGGTTYPNTTELYAGVTYKWFSAKYNHSISSSLFGLDSGTVGLARDINGNNPYNTPNTSTRGSGYLDLAANFEIAEKLTLGLHVGHQTVKNYSNFSYSDYKIGLTKEYGGFSFGAAVVSTNAKSEWWYAQTTNQVGTTSRTKIGEAGLVLSIAKTF